MEFLINNPGNKNNHFEGKLQHFLTDYRITEEVRLQIRLQECLS